MSIQQMLLGASGASGYKMDKSLRFRASASAYLNRTPASASNRKTWTWSGWVKRGVLVNTQSIFGARLNDDNRMYAHFNSSNELSIFGKTGASTDIAINTSAVFRDTAAWYHLVFVIDTTQATSTNRVKVYINGVQQTLTFTTTPSQNADLYINTAQPHRIGDLDGSVFLDGYMAEVNFIDGQALTPASFGSTNALTGVWQPKAYTGTYGTNGFYLDFEDTSSVSALGTDSSGNGNNWTVNNVSLTAGSSYDSMTDVPTLTSATTANYCVMNPLDKGSGVTVLNANMDVSITAASMAQVRSSFGMSSGKWYWEFTGGSGNNQDMAGVVKPNAGITSYVGADANGWGYYGSTGQKYNNGSGAAYGASYTNGDVIGVAFDADAGTLVFYKNNTSQGTAFTGLTSGPYFAAHSDGSAGSGTYAFYNFGQRPFAYTPPTGFLALNTFNLPTATILKGNTVMDATLYTGNNAARSITNAGGFQPDLVWIKDRTNPYSHILYDSVRGVGTTKMLLSNLDYAEGGVPNNANLTAFNSTGFALGTTVSTDVTNNTGDAFVAWQWQAGQGTTSSNTNGTITSTVSVNATAGFSVVTYTGTGGSATVGHGLGVAPSMIICKSRNAADGWGVYHVSLGNTNFLSLNTINASTSSIFAWNNTSPTSSVFSVNTNGVDFTNASGRTYVAYCFAPIAGYSAFGTYTGNGSTDGPFIYLGFEPKFIMAKRTNTTGNWNILDGVRDPSNAVGKYIYANASDAEGANASTLDFTANGFKLRQTFGDWNASGSTYVYMAFAENPFKNSLAR